MVETARPIRIVFFSDNFPPEGFAAATRVYERACYWAKWGHDVTVVTSNPNAPFGRIYPPYKNRWRQTEQMGGIRVVRVKTFMSPNEGMFLRILDYLSYMASAFVAGLVLPRPDVIVSTSPQLFCAVAAWAVAKSRRLPYVFELSDLWPSQIKAVGAMSKKNVFLDWIEKLELYLYREARRVIVLSPAFKTDLVARGIPKGKIDVILNGVDLERYVPTSGPDVELLEKNKLTGKMIFGYIGTLGMSQGLSNVLAAADTLRDRPEIHFLFVGAGAERRQLVAMADAWKLPNVTFIESQAKDTISRWWSLCQVALVHLKNTALFETVIPSKIFEAMGHGLPILLVSPSGVAREIIERESVGVWVQAGDPGALAQAIREMRNAPAQVRTFSRNSLRAAPDYSRERQARKTIEVIRYAIRPDSGATISPEAPGDQNGNG